MTKDSIKVLGSGELLESPAIIVPRKYLLFFSVDVSQIPSGIRQNFINQKIKQVCPFKTIGSYVVVDKGIAQVWTWDKSKTDRYQEEQELAALPLIPETLLLPPLSEGFREQICFEGWELQYWYGTKLMESRWFAVQPTEVDKSEFVRMSANSSALQLDWGLGSRDLLSKPFNEKPFWTKENLLQEATLTKLILGILSAYLVLQIGLAAGGLIKEHWMVYSIESKQKLLRERVQQRDATLDQQEFNHSLGSVLQAPTQLRILAELQKCLDGQSYTLLDWQYQHGQLTTLVQQEQPDTRALVENCSKSNLFQDFHAEPGSLTNQTRLQMKVKGSTYSEGSVNE